MLPAVLTSQPTAHLPDLHPLQVYWHPNALPALLLSNYQMVVTAALPPSCAYWQPDGRHKHYHLQLGQWATVYFMFAAQLALPLSLAVLASCCIYERFLAELQQRKYVQHLLAAVLPYTTGKFIDEPRAT